MKKLIMAVMVVAAAGFAAVAGTATSFAYQGVLRDETGKTLKQNQATITFRLWDAATGGNKLWENQMSVAIDTNGLFNAELAGGNLAGAIADAEQQGKAIYIGLTVKDSAGEISPRQKMIAAPLAAYAQNVAQADGNFTVAGTAEFKGAVSMQDKTSTLTAGIADVKGTMDVAGLSALKGGADVQKGLKVSGGLAVDGVQVNLPIGAIIMWAGSKGNVPDGWQLCDGSAWKGDANTYTIVGTGTDRNVPDLRGRFIVGAGGSYAEAATGGEEKHTLSSQEMPKHTHQINGIHGMSDDADDRDVWCRDIGGNKRSEFSYKTEETGGDSSGTTVAHENRPPYYALCYIIKYR